MDNSIVVRNTLLQINEITPSEIERSRHPITPTITITGSGFLGVSNIAVYAGPDIVVSNLNVVNDTKITVTFTITLETYRASYGVFVSGISGIGQIKSNSLPFKVYHWEL